MSTHFNQARCSYVPYRSQQTAGIQSCRVDRNGLDNGLPRNSHVSLLVGARHYSLR